MSHIQLRKSLSERILKDFWAAIKKDELKHLSLFYEAESSSRGQPYFSPLEYGSLFAKPLHHVGWTVHEVWCYLTSGSFDLKASYGEGQKTLQFINNSIKSLLSLVSISLPT